MEFKTSPALFSFLGILFCIATGLTQTLNKERLESAMNQFLEDAQTTHAIASLTVLNAQSGEEVYNYNGNYGLAPASTLKVLTSATGYLKLGKSYTYKTRLLYDGVVRNDTLYGDLIIKGTGDPSLGSWRYKKTKSEAILENWVGAIRNKGIRYISGGVIGDGGIFSSQGVPDGWQWEDIGNYYGAGSSGLTWHENQYDLFLRPGSKVDDPVAIIRTEPTMEELTFVNELSTESDNSGDQVYIYAAPYTTMAYVRGTAPANHLNFKVSGSLPDPALKLAQTLEKELSDSGIGVQNDATTTRLMEHESGVYSENDPQLLYTHESPEFSQLSYWFLKKSINLYGEHFLKTWALSDSDQPTTADGLDKLVEFWEDRGIDKEALHLMDGSGLSPGNRITTLALAKVLVAARNAEWYPDFYENLPVIHNIRMKSGTIRGVSAFAGYIDNAEGGHLAFSFIINNYNGRLGNLLPKIFKLLDQLKE